MPIELKEMDLPDEDGKTFGKHEEKAIISLAFDQPEFFAAILPYLKDDFFEAYESRFIFTIIKYHYEKDEVILSRALCKDIILESLTADDPHEEVIKLVERESDPREVPIITDKLIGWARQKAYGQLYSKESLEAHERGDYEQIEKLLEDAQKITNIGSNSFFFFDEAERLFEKEEFEKLTTGFARLDSVINMGGPSKGEVFVWMAPTGVGKSIALVNSGAACLKRGLNVLHVTLEMTDVKTGLRYMGCLTNYYINDRWKNEAQIKETLMRTKNSGCGQLIIAEYPPDEVSVDVIHAKLDMLRKLHGINIDVVVIDYLELMMSRVPGNNKEDYTRQKRAATEIARLAKKENVLVYTATQTNRSGNEATDTKGGDSKVIDINKVAESYGKTMPMDYLVTINQTRMEYEAGREVLTDENSKVLNARCRFFIVKNRNGAKFKTIGALINYETMGMLEQDFISGSIQTTKAKKEEKIDDD